MASTVAPLATGSEFDQFFANELASMGDPSFLLSSMADEDWMTTPDIDQPGPMAPPEEECINTAPTGQGDAPGQDDPYEGLGPIFDFLESLEDTTSKDEAAHDQGLQDLIVPPEAVFSTTIGTAAFGNPATDPIPIADDGDSSSSKSVPNTAGSLPSVDAATTTKDTTPDSGATSKRSSPGAPNGPSHGHGPTLPTATQQALAVVTESPSKRRKVTTTRSVPTETPHSALRHRPAQVPWPAVGLPVWAPQQPTPYRDEPVVVGNQSVPTHLPPSFNQDGEGAFVFMPREVLNVLGPVIEGLRRQPQFTNNVDYNMFAANAAAAVPPRAYPQGPIYYQGPACPQVPMVHRRPAPRQTFAFVPPRQ